MNKNEHRVTEQFWRCDYPRRKVKENTSCKLKFKMMDKWGSGASGRYCSVH